MKPTYKIITVIALVAVMLCGCMAPQTTITPENSATQNVTDTPAPPTTQPTDTKGPDCITTGPTLGVTPTAPTESATADTVTAEPGGTSDCVEPVQSYTALPIPTQSDAADIPEGGEDFPWVVVGISCGVIIAAIAVLVVVNKKNVNN